jgi:hypothetical protein
MVRVDGHVREARSRELIRDVREERSIADRHERLRELQRQRAEPGSEACAQDGGALVGIARQIRLASRSMIARSWMALRPLSTGLLCALSAFVLVHAGCGSDAVGVDDCRDIENARCVAGEACGLVDDVDACKRFYRDQCLHGLTAGERPGKPRVDECVKAIETAGNCRKKGSEDLVDCDPVVSLKTGLTKVCDVVKKPELIAECDFLYKPVEVPDATPDTSSDDGGSEGGNEDAGDDGTTTDAPAE